MPAPSASTTSSITQSTTPTKSSTAAGLGRTKLHPELLPGKYSGPEKTKGPKTGWKRPISWALAIFAVVNLGLAQASSMQQERSARSSGGDFWTNPALIDLAIKEYRAQKPPANVVLLGSSLMMFPFWAMDASFDPKIADIAHYHKSVALQAVLEKNGIKNSSVFSLASAGQMSSDAFLYANEFLKGDTKPEVVVWGIAPRDFADDNVKSPMATVSFKQIVDLHNFSSYAKTFLPRFEDKAEFIANHSCFLYGRRWRFQKEADRTLEKISGAIARIFTARDGLNKDGATVGGATPASTTVSVSSPASKSASTPDLAMSALLAGTAEQRWETSTREYRGRYKNIAERDLSVQMSCLDNTLKVCQERGIKVVLVNMPLTKLNQGLMADGFYQRFNQQVKTLATAYGKDVTLVDMTNQSQFHESDFWDTVHMNHIGGSKLIGGILPAIRSYLNK
ncbi:MAG: hypothetical protein WC028_18920 [Candidatus Obscuribacterales bacterium]